MGAQVSTPAPQMSADHPVCNVQNPLSVGAGDQGPWNSCAVFAVVSAVAEEVKERGKDIDVQVVSDGFLMGGHKNREGELIIEAGTDIPWVLHLMSESGFLFKTSAGEFLRVRLDCLKMTEESIDWELGGNYYPLSHRCVIAAAGKSGSHSNHALHCARGGIERSPFRVLCENSWGPEHSSPIVPGPMWPRVLMIYEVRVEVAEVKIRASGEWVPLYCGGFTHGQRVVVTRDIDMTKWGKPILSAGTKLVIDGGDANTVHFVGGVSTAFVSRLALAK